MELITLVSIVEVVLRDSFEALLFINNINNSSKEYIQKRIEKSMGNEFMLVDKTNVQYKKAFGINIKTLVNEDSWNNLIDMVNLRNMFIHNNGYIDGKFLKTNTYERLKDNIRVKLYCLKKEDIKKYFKSVVALTLAITDSYYKEYHKLSRKAIANFYFNESD